MARGRPPTPTAQHILTGTFRKDRHGDANSEPKPLEGIPKCPRDLSKAAKKVWKEVVRTMGHTGVITLTDGNTLRRYCTAVATIIECEELIAAVGIKANVSDSGRKYIKQLYVMLRGETDTMRTLGASLGLDPAARTRLKVSAAPKAPGVSCRDRNKGMPPPTTKGTA